jgi:hypothetical protein
MNDWDNLDAVLFLVQLHKKLGDYEEGGQDYAES